MRHGSVAGPILLIVIGVLFLLDNLSPYFSVFHVIANYWPVILIVIGIVKLLERTGRAPHSGGYIK